MAASNVYLDNMASTPVDPRVVESMAPFWSDAFGNPHSIDHSFGWRANEAIERAAGSVARLIGAEADEIVFTSGATEANNLAILGMAHRAPVDRRRIIVSAVEHKSALAAARAAGERYGMVSSFARYASASSRRSSPVLVR
jgi:cysteine desulfurase